MKIFLDTYTRGYTVVQSTRRRLVPVVVLHSSCQLTTLGYTTQEDIDNSIYERQTSKLLDNRVLLLIIVGNIVRIYLRYLDTIQSY